VTTSSKPFAGRVRAALVAISFVGPLALLCGLSAAQEQPAGGKPQTSAQKYKNIKVLKNLPADQLIPIMHKINDALGVKCDYCHVIGPNHTGFEKDDKPAKETARKMIVMTEELNKKVKAVDAKVTCFMCHHGSAEPQREPAS
jgi:photosynthetic reaction center cytochrome c subunit